MRHYVGFWQIGSHMSIRWFIRGRIKEKNSTIHAIKDQVHCVENTVQWLVNTEVILILVCNQCSKQTPLIIFPTYVDSSHSLNGFTKITVKEACMAIQKVLFGITASLCNWCLTVGCFFNI